MSYSDLYLAPRFRPSRIMVSIAIVAVTSAVLFFFSSDAIPTRASKRALKQHQVGNITPQSAGIFWESEVKDTGWVLYGEDPNKLTTIAHDTRDESEAKQARSHHYALLKNLKAETVYYYFIVSDNELIASPSQKPFEIQTPPLAGSVGILSPAYGKVIAQEGKTLGEGFVKIEVQDAYPLFGLVGKTGEWLIPLQHFVHKTRNSYLVVTEDTLAKITIFNAEQKSEVRVQLRNTNPIEETIVLGKNYSLLNSKKVLSANTTRRTESVVSYDVGIRFPLDKSVIPGTAPLIKGYGVPGKLVTATIDSLPPFSATVLVDQKGQWNVENVRKLNPGKYTLTIATENKERKRVEIKHAFTIIKSGERVLGDSTVATPSATIAVSTSPKPSPTTRLTPSISLTVTISPTLTPAASPTVAPPQASPTPEVSTPTPEPPVSGGNSLIPYAVSGAGLLLIGTVLFFAL